jgi:type II secretory pathway pseudopilin PulG
VRIVVLTVLVVAVLVLLASLQALSGLVRTLPTERRVRRVAHSAQRDRRGRHIAVPAGLEQLEKLVGDALGGDPYALDQLARSIAAAGRSCGLDPEQLAVLSGASASPTALLQALDALEGDTGLPDLPRPGHQRATISGV